MSTSYGCRGGYYPPAGDESSPLQILKDISAFCNTPFGLEFLVYFSPVYSSNTSTHTLSEPMPRVVSVMGMFSIYGTINV